MKIENTFFTQESPRKGFFAFSFPKIERACD
nr:MAG TPA: hypothetical protein [Caudoviricetes sp.]